MKKLTINKQGIADMLKKKWGFIVLELLILAVAIALDLCMKEFLFELLESKPSQSMTLIPGFMDLTYSQNTGAGFGILSGSTLALTILTTIVIVGILLYLVVYHSDGEYLRIPLVLIAAGGIGNLVDRVELGYVRDFFEFTFVKFAIFNIADIFVTIGAIFLIIALIYMMTKEAKKSKKKFAEQQAATENLADGADTNAFLITENLADGADTNAFSIVENSENKTSESFVDKQNSKEDDNN